jgi:hypothetical protein
MKQFTTPEQTAKLIELGFEKPKSEVKAEQAGDYAWYNPAYSIGELIEMLPEEIEGVTTMFGRNILRNEVSYFSRMLELERYLSFKNDELIDNLFDMVVKLKEEGVI